MLCYLRQNGQIIKSIELSVIPRRGDIVSLVDSLKRPCYLVLRVEISSTTVTLHVKEFHTNEQAKININGFNNMRPF